MFTVPVDHDAGALTMASPRPRSFRSLLTVLRPFRPLSWAAAVSALLLMQLLLLAVARAEERVLRRGLPAWSAHGNAAWYAFGTLLGESVARDAASESAWALRYTVT